MPKDKGYINSSNVLKPSCFQFLLATGRQGMSYILRGKSELQLSVHHLQNHSYVKSSVGKAACI